MTKRVGKYVLGEVLGEGSYGRVKRATHEDTKEQVAIKEIDKEKAKQVNLVEHLKKEIMLMRMTHHPNVVKLIEVLASKSKIYVVLEYVEGGDLYDKIRKCEKIPEPVAKEYFSQIISGLEHCLDLKIVHRDLKPENILVTTDGVIKISDFGFSVLASFDEAKLLHTTCGTLNYIAPEVIKNAGYEGHKADIWSCGVILYYMLGGYLPFDDESLPKLIDKIVLAQFELPPHISEEAKDLLLGILVANPNKRLNVSQIKNHAWLKKVPDPPTIVKLTEGRVLIKAGSKELTDLNPDEYEPIKMDAFEFASCCTGKLLNGLFELKHISSETEEMKTAEIQTEFVTNVKPKEYLQLIYHAMAKTNAKVKVDQKKGKIYAIYHQALKDLQEVIITCQAYKLTEEFSFILFKKEQGDTGAFIGRYNNIYAQIIAKLNPPALKKISK